MAIFLKGQYRLFQNLKKLSEAARKTVGEAVARSAEAIAREAGAKAPADTGLLRSAVKAFILRGGMTAQVRALPGYALAVEMGYKGISGRGNRRNAMPVRKIGGKWRVVPELEAWALRKGIPPFALARAIHRKGHKATPFLFEAMEREKAAFLAAVEKAIAEDMVRKAGIPQGPGNPEAA